jgi:hypothetical protein
METHTGQKPKQKESHGTQIAMVSNLHKIISDSQNSPLR